MAAPALTRFPQYALIELRWLLDEASGDRADAIGSVDLGDNNTVAAGAGLSDLGGSFDNSAFFTAANSEFLRNNNPGASVMSGNQDFTVALWVQVASTPGSNTQRQMINKFGTADAERAWDFHYRNSSGTLLLRFSNQTGASGVTVNVTKTLTVDTWFRVMAIFDLSAGSVKFMSNGVQVGTTQTGLNTSVNASATADITLGAVGDTASQFWDGLMQDAIFWGGVALSDAEALDDYEVYTTAPPAASAAAKSYAYLMSFAGAAVSLAPLTKMFCRHPRTGLLVPGPAFAVRMAKLDVERIAAAMA